MEGRFEDCVSIAHAFAMRLFGGLDVEAAREVLGVTRVNLIVRVRATGYVRQEVRACAVVVIREATVLKGSAQKVTSRTATASRQCVYLVPLENSRQPTVLQPACPACPANTAPS